MSAYRELNLSWKRRQVLGVDLNPSESGRVRVAHLIAPIVVWLLLGWTAPDGISVPE
jgi:hypothetical protein